MRMTLIFSNFLTQMKYGSLDDEKFSVKKAKKGTSKHNSLDCGTLLDIAKTDTHSALLKVREKIIKTLAIINSKKNK